MIPNGRVRPGLELMTYLDGNLSSRGLDDPALNVSSFLFSWWTNTTDPGDGIPTITSATINSALNHYHDRLAESLTPFGPPHFIRDFTSILKKPAYTWHRSVTDDMPNTCMRCRLYRAVSLGIMDKVQDTFNMAHACQLANEAEMDIAMRRASGFNELYEAALKKESEGEQRGTESDPINIESESIRAAWCPIDIKEQLLALRMGQKSSASDRAGKKSKGKQKEKASIDRFGPDFEDLLSLLKSLVRQGAEMMSAKSKWTWGDDLTEMDLRRMIRTADEPTRTSRSDYDDELPSGSNGTKPSEHSAGRSIDNPDDPELWFDELSEPVMEVPELDVPARPLEPQGQLAYPEPEADPADPILIAFSKAKREVQRMKMQAPKLIIQHEVDEPASFGDFVPEFIPQHALLCHRPWLAPTRPTLVRSSHNVNPENPPSTPTFVPMADSDSDHDVPDHIILPDSDLSDSDDVPDHIVLPDSDDVPDHIDLPDSDDIPDHIVIPDSDSSDMSDVCFPVSDDDDDGNRMEIVESDRMADSAQAPMDIAPLPSSVRFTGPFTAASFSHFPDELLD